MTDKRELELLKKIEKLENIIAKSNKKKEEVTTYYFSKITLKQLKKIVTLKKMYQHNVLKKWLNSGAINIAKETSSFLKNLLNKEKYFIGVYKEEELKIHFIGPILNHINFRNFDLNIRDFYEEQLVYATDHFILSGSTDFMVAKGMEYAEKPYFFIQEFKKGLDARNPEPQLLAELIAAIELNHFKFIKGAYIIGAIWYFVILEKISKHNYQYVISRIYNSTNLKDLIKIYKNILFVKDEIIRLEYDK